MVSHPQKSSPNPLVSNLKRQVKRLLYPRRTQLYCVGTAKSGTHSIAAIFDDSVRSQHEAGGEEAIDRILAFHAGNLTQEELKQYVRKRSKQLYLEIDASQVNYYFLEILLEEFPKAKFLITIRDCYSWLDSFINDSLRRETSPKWIKFRNLRFQANTLTHPSEEKVLQENGLYTLDGYLSYWASHNQKVLSTVPTERLMVVKTKEITNKAYEICEFAGFPSSVLRVDRSHRFKNPKKYGILQQIDREYLTSKVDRHCQELMEKFFPNIKTLEDAGL
ncbi:sulfotransferase [Baaleninema sp.]|uniref:sulfotransferase n=1 Tax=Baaleninema sp. TaxID=3101197 RepID=UPI003D031290